MRLIGKYTGDTPLTSATNLVGGLPAPLVQASYKVTALQREVLKPWFIVRNLHNTETLARMESIDKFMAAMPGYPGKAFQQICEQLMLGNNLYNDAVTLAGREIKLSALSVPVLAIGGTTDVIAPIASVGSNHVGPHRARRRSGSRRRREVTSGSLPAPPRETPPGRTSTNS